MIGKKLKFVQFYFGLTCGIWIALCGPVNSQTLPATLPGYSGSWSVGIWPNGQSSLLPGAYTMANANAHAAALAVPYNGGTVLTTAEGNLTTASASFTYYFEVIGPQMTFVPINVSGYLGALQIFDPRAMSGSASASLSISNSFGYNFSDWACYGPPCYFQFPTSRSSHAFFDTLNILSDTIYQVDLSASSSTWWVGNAYSYIKADADPYFQIDPSFSLANEFTFVESQGVTNSPVVAGIPESTTWAMMILGFAAIAANHTIRHRRRRRMISATCSWL